MVILGLDSRNWLVYVSGMYIGDKLHRGKGEDAELDEFYGKDVGKIF